MPSGIYNVQPRSMTQSIKDWAEIDDAKQRRQINALALQDRQRGIEEATAIQNAMAGLAPDATPEQAAMALRRLGPKGMGLADSLLKTEAEVGYKKAQAAREGTQSQKDVADAQKAGVEALAKSLSAYRDMLPMVRTRQDAVQWTAAQYQDPTTKAFVSRIPMEQMVQNIPEDEAGFNQWRQEVGMGIEKFVQSQTTKRGQDITAETSRANNAATNARLAADAAAGRAVTMRGQDLTDARQRDLNQLTKEDKETARATEKKDKAVTDYSKTLQKEGIPDFEDALSTLEDKLSKYKPGQAPGVGRGAGLIPDFLQGQEAEDLTNSIAAVKNTLLKARSGSAVSESELRRLVQELGTGGFRSEETVRNAIKSIRSRFEKVKANVVAGVTDDVKTEYESRGGVPITRGGAKPAGAFADAEKERRYQEWKAKQK